MKNTIDLFPQSEREKFRMQSFACDKLLLRREEGILLLEDTIHQYCSRYTNTIILLLPFMFDKWQRIRWSGITDSFVSLKERLLGRARERERERMKEWCQPFRWNTISLLSRQPYPSSTLCLFIPLIIVFPSFKNVHLSFLRTFSKLSSNLSLFPSSCYSTPLIPLGVSIEWV